MRDNRDMTTQRETLTAELIDAGRHLVERGLVQASGGNLSVRLPDTDRFLVTGSGTWLGRLTPDDFAELTLDGERVGGAERPSIEWRLHERTYAARPPRAVPRAPRAPRVSSGGAQGRSRWGPGRPEPRTGRVSRAPARHPAWRRVRGRSVTWSCG